MLPLWICFSCLGTHTPLITFKIQSCGVKKVLLLVWSNAKAISTVRVTNETLIRKVFPYLFRCLFKKSTKIQSIEGVNIKIDYMEYMLNGYKPHFIPSSCRMALYPTGKFGSLYLQSHSVEGTVHAPDSCIRKKSLGLPFNKGALSWSADANCFPHVKSY